MSDDAKLQAAIDECVAVCRKHDVSGIIVVSTDELTRFAMPLDTTWNYVRLEGDFLRVRTEAGDSLELKKQKVTATVAALSGIAELIGLMREGIEKVFRAISREGFEITFVNTVGERRQG